MMGLKKALRKFRKRLKRLTATELTQFGMIIREKGKYHHIVFYLPLGADDMEKSIRHNERAIEIIEIRRINDEVTEESLIRRVDTLNRRESRIERRRQDVPALLRR